MNDDDRIAYLAGDDGVSLDPGERAELDALRAVLADSSTWDEPPQSLEGSVVAAIADAARNSPAVATAAAVEEPQVVSLATARTRRSWTMLSAAAAVVALVAVGALLFSRNSNSDAEFTAELEPTELVPSADGRAELRRTDSGWEIVVDASGLPRRDGGDFYQGWLKDADGNLVTIGTFNEGADVVLWAGVSPVDFSLLTITEETNDGDPASSGRVVLKGLIVDG
jgi:hypothetical protein